MKLNVPQSLYGIINHLSRNSRTVSAHSGARRDTKRPETLVIRLIISCVVGVVGGIIRIVSGIINIVIGIISGIIRIISGIVCIVGSIIRIVVTSAVVPAQLDHLALYFHFISCFVPFHCM